MNIMKYFGGSNFWWHAFRMAGKLNNPKMAARLLALSLEHLVKRKGTEGTCRVLLLSKAGFREDALSSIGNDDRFEISSLDVVRNKAFKAIATNFLPPEIDDCNYQSDEPGYIEAKNRYRDFLRSFWSQFQKIVGIDAVLTANFSYYAERELSGVLDEMETPFIVLHKENLKSPGRVEFYKKLYRERRGPFLGRKIFVYNEIEKAVQIDAGIVTPERVIVTGMPRLDRIHEWRKTKGAGPEGTRQSQVLFFAFEPGTGLPSIPRKPRSGVPGGYERIGDGLDELEWTDLFRECHHAARRLASENPDIKVVIKAKGNLSKGSRLYEILGMGKKLPPNLKIAVGGDPFEMIVHSNVVCGMNTTGLFEALAAGKPVVVPKFSEALDSRMQAYLVDMEDSVLYASSPDDLVAKLKAYAKERCSRSTELSEGTKKILQKWTGNADGLSGLRVREALLKEIETPHRSFLGRENKK